MVWVLFEKNRECLLGVYREFDDAAKAAKEIEGSFVIGYPLE